MKKTAYCAILLATLSGCATVAKPPVQPTLPKPTPQVQPSVVKQKPLISEEYINQRLQQYGQKLMRWKQIDNDSVNREMSAQETEQIISCFRSLQKVRQGYSSLQSAYLKPESEQNIDNELIAEVQRQDIAFSDGKCGTMLAEPQSQNSWASSKLQGLDQIEAHITELTENKKFEDIVQMWNGLTASEQQHLSIGTQLAYINALTYLHQERESIAQLQKIVDKINPQQGTDLLSLRKMMADRYVAVGDYKNAQKQYQNIEKEYGFVTSTKEWAALQLSILARSDVRSTELTAYSQLLQEYLSFLPEQDGYRVSQNAANFLTNYPHTPIASNVDKIQAATQKQADIWYKEIWNQVDALTAKQNYEAAIEVLQAVPLALIDQEKASTISKKIEELLLADAVNRETRKMAEMQELQQKWNNGLLLVSGERYPEAIEVFKTLEGTDYNDKAVEKISEVSLLAAKAERRKAADAYIRYTKTSDPESQKKMLVESRKILLNILVEYPNSEIENKVRSNISRVEQEINGLDPSLLQELQNQETSEQSPATAREVDIFSVQ